MNIENTMLKQWHVHVTHMPKKETQRKTSKRTTKKNKWSFISRVQVSKNEKLFLPRVGPLAGLSIAHVDKVTFILVDSNQLQMKKEDLIIRII